MTVNAGMVAAAFGGLPKVWQDRHGVFQVIGAEVLMGHEEVNLTDYQTMFGVGLMLDEWEQAGNPLWPHRQGMSTLRLWVDRVAMHASSGGKVLQWLPSTMARRLYEIGRDHMLQRELGWTVKAGVMLEWSSPAPGVWFAKQPGVNDCRQFHHNAYPVLADITLAVDARDAVYVLKGIS